MTLQRHRCLFAVVFVCLLTLAAWPQVSTSRIEGTVVDATGAVVSNAAVKVTNEDTSVSYDAKTSSTGSYTVPSLTPGPYTVSITARGFERFSSIHNVLSVGTPLVVNITLKVGATSEVVEVQGAYERIETTNATLGEVMTTQQ